MHTFISGIGLVIAICLFLIIAVTLIAATLTIIGLIIAAIEFGVDDIIDRYL